jgi:hypothetical protein
VASQWSGNARANVFSGCSDAVVHFFGSRQLAHGNPPP